MANTYLTRTPSSTGSRRKFTFSFWIKRSAISSSQTIYNVRPDSNGANRLSFHSSDTFRISFEPINKYLFTNRVFVDPTSWSHIVVAVDTEQGTAADRVKLYVNGVQETSFSTETYPDQNTDLDINTQNVINIGRNLETSSNYFDGLISHFHFIDGTQYAASDFGLTDVNTGEWIINTSPSVTYGTNGFFILKDGNSVTDQSPNTNNFTVSGGTLTSTEDNPSNNFAIISELAGNPLELQNGGLKSVASNGATSTKNPNFFSTIGYNTGKFYWETKISNFSTGSGHSIGIVRTNTGHIPVVGGGSVDTGQSIPSNITLKFGEATPYISHYGTNVQSGSVGSFSSGDIVACSHDLSAGEFKFFKNGSQIGTTITGMSSSGDGYFYLPFWLFESKSSTRYCTMEWNMGNGYFGTTAVSSNSGNGYSATGNLGIFQHQPPTGGYTALCTKGLNL